MAQLGKYQLVRRIAVGGMAELYLARQSGLEGFEKTVVVKKLLPEYAGDEDTVRMFLQEARFAASLGHPNIAQIFDLGKVDDDYFIAMELVDGADLRRCQERAEDVDQPMPFPLTAYVVSCVCRGLHHAHSLRDREGNLVGLVHRDVSPQNVLIARTGEVKLVDFGIAKATNAAAQTQAGLLKGKYAYMSPEQCRGDELDARSDIFSAGILLYELICRRRLFKRQNEFATMHAVMEQPIAPPSAVSDEVPDELEMIAMRALSRERGDRYNTAEEMQLELQAAVRDNGWEVGQHVLARYMSALFDGAAGLDAEAKPSAQSHVATVHGVTAPSAPSGPEEAATRPRDPAASAVAHVQQPPQEIPPETSASLSYDGDDDFGDEATVAEQAGFADARFDLSDDAPAAFGEAEAHELESQSPATLIGTGAHHLPEPITQQNKPDEDAPREVVVPLSGIAALAPAPALSPEPITDAGADEQRIGAETLDDVDDMHGVDDEGATEIDRDGDLRQRVLAAAAAEADERAEAHQAAQQQQQREEQAPQDQDEAPLLAQIARESASPTALPPPTLLNSPPPAPRASAAPASTRAVASSATAQTLTEDSVPSAERPGLVRSPTEDEVAPTMVARAPTAAAPNVVPRDFAPMPAGPDDVTIAGGDEDSSSAEALLRRATAPTSPVPTVKPPPGPRPAPAAATPPAPAPPPAASPFAHPDALAATHAMPAHQEPSAQTAPTPPAATPSSPSAIAFAPADHGGSPLASKMPSPPIAGATLEISQPPMRRGASRTSLIIAVVIATVLVAGAAVGALVLRSRSAAGKTELMLTSTPAGAIVFVDGKKRAGVTPMKLVDLRPGKQVRLVLMAQGHENWQKKLSLEPGAKRTVNAKLVPKATGGKATIHVVVPAGAKVYLDGEAHGRGTQTISVDTGVPHSITVKQTGKADGNVKVPALRRGEKRSYRITPGKRVEKLEPAGGAPAGSGTGGAGDGRGSVEIPRGRAAGIRGTAGSTVPPAK